LGSSAASGSSNNNANSAGLFLKKKSGQKSSADDGSYEDEVEDSNEDVDGDILVSADRLLELLEEVGVGDEDYDVGGVGDDDVEEEGEAGELTGSSSVIITDDFEIYARPRPIAVTTGSQGGIGSQATVSAGSWTFSRSSREGGILRNRRASLVRLNVASALNYSGEGSVDFTPNKSTYQPHLPLKTRLGALWSMCRPNNFVFVVLLHLLGMLQVSNASNLLSMHALSLENLSMSMWPTLAALILSASTSMVINDIHDAESGVDSLGVSAGGKTMSTKPLLTGIVSMLQAKRFLGALYALLSLIVFSSVKGTLGKMFFIANAIITGLYTPVIKPMTWYKNIVCATLVAGAPVCSGTIALTLQGRSYANLIKVIPLTLAMYLQVFAREMVMDLKDYEGDRNSHISTVPVRYGRKYAGNTSMVSIGLMGVIAIGSKFLFREESSTFWIVKLLLATAGSLSMLSRVNAVRKVEGIDLSKNMSFIDDNLGMLMILASFI